MEIQEPVVTFTTTLSDQELFGRLEQLGINAEHEPSFDFVIDGWRFLLMRHPKEETTPDKKKIARIRFYGRCFHTENHRQIWRLDDEVISFALTHVGLEQLQVKCFCFVAEFEPALYRMLEAMGARPDPLDEVEQSLAQNFDELRPDVELPKRQGMREGTRDRVAEFHRLRKQGESLRQAAKQAQCDKETYYRHCKKVTGEDPR